jgi:hypothetical protein
LTSERQLRKREELEQHGGPQGWGAHSGDLLTRLVNWKPVIAAPHGYAMGLAFGIVNGVVIQVFLGRAWEPEGAVRCCEGCRAAENRLGRPGQSSPEEKSEA